MNELKIIKPPTFKKEKSPIAIEEAIIKRAKNIFDEFKNFTNGYHVLLLLQRHKEGGETNNTKIQKIVSRNPKEYLQGLEKLVEAMTSSDKPLRVYASLNERDIEKAIRQFKYEQLESDYYDQEQKENFYLDSRNRFVGALMQPQQRKTNMFLFDVDNEEGRDVMGETLRILPPDVIIQQYPTKNGWHIITSPFNYTTITLPKGCEFKKDGLILLAY